jgi:hypothetical protein
MSNAKVRVLFAAGCALILLSACSVTENIGLTGPSRESKPQNCPGAGAIVPTSSLTTFKEGMTNDPKGVLYRIAITGVSTECSLDADNGITDSSLTINFKATRTDAGGEVTFRAPYYVAVARDAKVLDKNDAWISFTFPAGETAIEFSETVPSTKITLDNGRKPYEYELVAGMQLTHNQLDYNNTTSHYGP